MLAWEARAEGPAGFGLAQIGEGMIEGNSESAASGGAAANATPVFAIDGAVDSVAADGRCGGGRDLEAAEGDDANAVNGAIAAAIAAASY